MTADQAAFALLLARDERGLTSLATRMKNRLENREPCPDCGDEGPHDDNGAIGDELAFCCQTCGMHFHPDSITVTLPRTSRG